MAEHHYDDAGRLVRTVTRREPEWSDDDQQWILALAEHRRLRCPSCGGYMPECCDTDDTFTVDQPVRCHRTTAIARAAERYKDTPQAGALLFVARR